MINLGSLRHFRAPLCLVMSLIAFTLPNFSTAADLPNSQPSSSQSLYPLPQGYTIYSSQLDLWHKIMNFNINMDSSQTDEQALARDLVFDPNGKDSPWAAETRAQLLVELKQSRSTRDLIKIIYENLDVFYTEYSNHLQKESNQKDAQDLTRKFYQAFEGAAKKKREYSERNLPIYFFIGTDKTFQVDGVNPDRLAINTGSEIIFNVRKLNEKSNWTVGELVQILSHEVLHLIKDVELPSKDKWSTEFGNWATTNTTVLELPTKETAIVIDLSKNREPAKRIKETSYQSLEEFFLQNLKRTILVIKKSSTTAAVWDSFYEGFQSFEGEIGQKMDRYQRASEHIYYKVFFPIIKFISAKLNSKGQVVLDYSQSGKTYMYSSMSQIYMDPKTMGTPEYRWYNFPDDIKSTSYRMEYSANSSQYDLKRSYDTKLSEHDFEISRIIEIKDGKKYVSLRLKLSAEELKNFPLQDFKNNLFLVARSPSLTNALSLPLGQFRYLNNTEVLLHFEIPDIPLDLAYLQLPILEKDQRGFEKTTKILPSQKQEIAGNLPNPKSVPTINKVSVVDDNNESRYLNQRAAPKITIEMDASKLIKGVLFDIEHLVSAYGVDWNGSKQNMLLGGYWFEQDPARDEIAKVSMGKNYFVEASKITKKGSSITLELPTDVFNETVYGQEYTKTLFKSYKVKLREQRQKLADTGYRRMTDVWIYYQDGMVQRIDRQRLPYRFRNGHLLEKDKPNPAPQKTVDKPAPIISCQKVHLKNI